MEKKKNINEKVFENIIIAVAVILYFIIINFSYCRVEEDMLQTGLKIISIVILILSIIIFEIAYKKDNGEIVIYGIETLILALHALSIIQVVEITKIKFTTYILISSYIIGIYYILKSSILYTIDRKKYLESLSDIKEIVNSKPIKKEGRKKIKK